MAAQIRRMTPVTAAPERQPQLVNLSRVLQSVLSTPRPTCELLSSGGDRTPIPESALRLLARVVEITACGDAVTVVATGKEITTQQAAELLNVSRQYVVRLLDEGRIPFRKTGAHRRLRIDDVLSFKEQRYRDRKAGLRELTQASQKLGGYDSK